MTHPCADHLSFCDHCVCCDVVGICCQTIPPEVCARLEADAARDGLRAAIEAEAGTVPSLRELVCLDAERQRPAPLLPAPSPLVLPRSAAEHIPNDSRKEAIHVLAPRTPR